MKSPIPALNDELWIAKHLGNRALFAGVTTPADRRERVRKEIILRKLERAQAGVRKNRPETWQQLFERVYQLPLVQESPPQESAP